MTYEGSKPLPSNPSAEEIETIVSEMFHESATLKQCAMVLREEYLSKKNRQPERAKSIAMSLTKYKMRLEQARIYVAARLREGIL